jgi:hypothetical protein
MANHLYLAIDPSFRRTGFSYFLNSRIVISQIETQTKEASLADYYNTSTIIVNKLASSLPAYDSASIVIEAPPPVSQFSAGLYMLVALLIDNLLTTPHTKLYTLPTAITRTIYGARSIHKTDLKNFAEKLHTLNLHLPSQHLRNDGTLHNVEKWSRIPHDSAESYIMLLYLLDQRLLHAAQEDSFDIRPASEKGVLSERWKWRGIEVTRG